MGASEVPLVRVREAVGRESGWGREFVKTCATCRHWSDDVQERTGLPELRECEKIPHFEEAKEWNKNFNGSSVKAKYADVLAFAEDGSGYMANLLTMATFGCVMHEETPRETS